MPGRMRHPPPRAGKPRKGPQNPKPKKGCPGQSRRDTLSWHSSNKKVAKVNSKGRVTAVKKGKATTTAKARDGSGKKNYLQNYKPLMPLMPLTPLKSAGQNRWWLNKIKKQAQVFSFWEHLRFTLRKRELRRAKYLNGKNTLTAEVIWPTIRLKEESACRSPLN